MTFAARPHAERPSIRIADAIADLVIATLERAHAVPRDDRRRPCPHPPPAERLK